jgi:predicted RND superfamily exporter protein
LPSKGAGQADLPSPEGGQHRLHALAFGIERLGLVSLRFPLPVALVTILLAIAAGVGIFKLNVDDSLSELFRSDTAEFRQYEDVTTRFPSTEFDVLVVIEGENLLARELIGKLRGLAEDLQLIDGTRGLISLFSARQPPERRGTPAPLFPDELPEGAAYQKLVNRVMKNEILRGKLLSEDGQLTLMVLALSRQSPRATICVMS